MRILLISYYFPPAGGAAVQRWLRLINYLVQRGVEVGVICSKGGDYPFIDESLMGKIPKTVRVIRCRAPRMSSIWKRVSGKDAELPYGDLALPKRILSSRLLVLLRLNLIIPDLRVVWNPSAYRTALAELRRIHYDSIITTGPPHSTHLIGLALKRRTGIRWFTDFRDPWLGIHYLKLNPPWALSRYIHKRLEKLVLTNSRVNFIISEAIAEELPPARKIVLYNGFDPHDFAGLVHHQAPILRLKYVGQLTAGQDLGWIVDFANLLQRETEISLIGTKLSQADRAAAAGQFRLLDFVPHDQALQEMVDSDLLLLLVNEYEGNQGMLTTKLFEYLASRSPVLCIGPKDGAAAKVIMDTQSGQCFAKDEIRAAAEWVNSLPEGQRTNGDISPYSVDNQVDILIKALK